MLSVVVDMLAIIGALAVAFSLFVVYLMIGEKPGCNGYRGRYTD